MPITYKPFAGLAKKVYTEPAKKAFRFMFPKSIAGQSLGYVPPVKKVLFRGENAQVIASIGEGVDINFTLPLEVVGRF